MTVSELRDQLVNAVDEIRNDEAKMRQIRREAIIEVWGSEKAYSDAKAILRIFEG